MASGSEVLPESLISTQSAEKRNFPYLQKAELSSDCSQQPAHERNPRLNESSRFGSIPVITYHLEMIAP
jgi:hypothetical protein